MLAYFGLALMLIGVISLAVGEINLRNTQTSKIGQEYSVWSYACNLAERSSYGVDIQATDDWTLPFGRGDFRAPQPVNVTITSPDGDVTRLRVYYYSEPSTSPFYEIGIPAYIVGVSYLNVDVNGLTVDSSEQIRFTAKQSGYYNISVIPESVWSSDAPDYILVFEIAVPNRATYAFLATVGGVAATVGGVALVVGIVRGKPRRTREVANRRR